MSKPTSKIQDPTQPLPSQKQDNGKPRWSLIPWEAMDRVLETFEFGAVKYPPDNWKRVENGKQRFLESAFRHLVKHMKGIKNDNESGLSHLSHVCADLLIVMALEEKEKTNSTLSASLDNTAALCHSEDRKRPRVTVTFPKVLKKNKKKAKKKKQK